MRHPSYAFTAPSTLHLLPVVSRGQPHAALNSRLVSIFCTHYVFSTASCTGERLTALSTHCSIAMLLGTQMHFCSLQLLRVGHAGGDPFLWEVYRRVGASEILAEVTITNKVIEAGTHVVSLGAAE